MLSSPARTIEQEVEADNLEHARVIAPVAYVNVFDVGQLADQFSAQAGFLVDLAQGRLLRLLAFVDGALRQSGDSRS